ncbi:MAG: hypothetical protein AAF958_00635 [Planctomycetota bacterium]
MFHRVRVLLCAGMLGLAPAINLLAHEGHNGPTVVPPSHPLHSVLEPQHALPVVAVVCTLAIAALVIKRRFHRAASN